MKKALFFLAFGLLIFAPVTFAEEDGATETGETVTDEITGTEKLSRSRKYSRRRRNLRRYRARIRQENFGDGEKFDPSMNEEEESVGHYKGRLRKAYGKTKGKVNRKAKRRVTNAKARLKRGRDRVRKNLAGKKLDRGDHVKRRTESEKESKDKKVVNMRQKAAKEKLKKLRMTGKKQGVRTRTRKRSYLRY